MKLISCYHPKVIKNKYSGEIVVSRCGKCPACLNARAAQWVQRLDQEMLQHRYTAFGTLQFDEQHVKQLVLLDIEDRPSNFPAYIDYQSGQVYDLADVPDVTSADIQYCEDTRFLLVHDIKDYQIFIKSLRKDLYENYGNERLRYYIGLEFGPTSYRPHAHFLFFFDSPSVAKDIQELCTKHWKNGNAFGCHIVDGSASKYVASYVNSFASLPKIYLHPCIRQKALFSKCPPIGTFTWSEQKVKEFFDKGISQMSLFRKDLSQFYDVPLWRSLQDRLYPKIVAFNRLSHYDRVLLYGFGFEFIEQQPEKLFGEFTSSERKEINFMWLSNKLAQPYWQPYFRCLETKNKCEHSHYYSLSEDSLSRFVSAVRRVCINALAWNVSIEDYVTKIELFYENLEKKQLCDYYHAQDDYFKCHPISDFLAFNPNFCLAVSNKLPSLLTKEQRLYLEFYAPNLLASEKPIFIHYNKTSAYQSLRGIHDKIAFQNTKQKKSNDYLLTHKDKFNNIITYNQEINNYVKSQII